MSALLNWLNSNSGVGVWFAGVCALLAVIMALFGERLKNFLFGPKLNINFGIDNKWCRDQTFNDENNVPKYEGKNCLLEIINMGRSVAINVTARVEKVVKCKPSDCKDDNTYWYHPSPLHWSGTSSPDDSSIHVMNPVDIYPNSYYFLDFIAIILRQVKNDIGESIFAHNNPPFWNLWVDNRPGRGLGFPYYCKHKYSVYFHLAADKVKAKRYVAEISFSKDSFMPKIIGYDIKNGRKNKVVFLNCKPSCRKP